jgi:hypothetical protein
LAQLVVIGGTEEAILDDVGVSDVGCFKANCDATAKLPMPLTDHVAAWLDDRLVVCGGKTTGNVPNDQCWVFDR